MVGRENPVIERSFGAGGCKRPRWRCRSRLWRGCKRCFARPAGQSSAGIEQRRRRPIQQLFRPQLFQLFLHPPQSGLSGKFRGAKLSSGKIQRGKSHMLSHLRECGQEIVFLRPQQRIRRRPGSDHPRHFATNQLRADLLPGQARIFHLLANGYFETFTDELPNVAFRRVVGHSAHGHRDAFLFVAGSERDLQLLRRHDGILEEKLIKVSQAKKQQGSGMIFLDGGILPH